MCFLIPAKLFTTKFYIYYHVYLTGKHGFIFISVNKTQGHDNLNAELLHRYSHTF
jgi:hypothetical protein